MKKTLLFAVIFLGLAFGLARKAEAAYCGNGMCEANEDPYNCPADCAGIKVYCGKKTCSDGTIVEIFCSSACGGGNICWEDPTCKGNVCTTNADCPNAVDLGVCPQGGGSNCRNWDQCGCAKSCTPYCSATGVCIYMKPEFCLWKGSESDFRFRVSQSPF